MTSDFPDAPAGWRFPKVVDITDQQGVSRPYLISKFPAAMGRELVSKYPVANMPKLGDYKVSEECMYSLMTRVAALQPDKKQWVPLSSSAIYDNHVPDWEVGAKIEGAMWEHNCSFFGNGKTSIFFGDIARNLQQWITSTLTGLLAQSLKQTGQASET